MIGLNDVQRLIANVFVPIVKDAAEYTQPDFCFALAEVDLASDSPAE